MICFWRPSSEATTPRRGLPVNAPDVRLKGVLHCSLGIDLSLKGRTEVKLDRTERVRDSSEEVGLRRGERVGRR